MGVLRVYNYNKDKYEWVDISTNPKIENIIQKIDCIKNFTVERELLRKYFPDRPLSPLEIFDKNLKDKKVGYHCSQFWYNCFWNIAKKQKFKQNNRSKNIY